MNFLRMLKKVLSLPASSPSLLSPNAVFGCGVPDLEEATEFTAEVLVDAMRVLCRSLRGLADWRW